MDIFKWWGHSRNVKKKKRKKKQKKTIERDAINAVHLRLQFSWLRNVPLQISCFLFRLLRSFFVFLLSWEWSLAFFTLLTSLVFCCCCCLDDGERNYRTILSQRAPVFKVCGLPHQLTHVTLSADDTGKDTPNTQKPIGYLNTFSFFLMP